MQEQLQKLSELSCKDFSLEAVTLYNSLKDNIDHLVLENNVTTERLSHLLESNFIRTYDKKNPLTSNYELNINELDQMLEQYEMWQKNNSALVSNDDIYAWTFDELLKMIEQGYKRIKVTRELYTELEDKINNVKHNNEDPISSFFGIEIYIDL